MLPANLLGSLRGDIGTLGCISSPRLCGWWLNRTGRDHGQCCHQKPSDNLGEETFPRRGTSSSGDRIGVIHATHFRLGQESQAADAVPASPCPTPAQAGSRGGLPDTSVHYHPQGPGGRRPPGDRAENGPWVAHHRDRPGGVVSKG
jgi:hypothetical protein